MYFSWNFVGVIMVISVSCGTTQDNSAASMPTEETYAATEENKIETVTTEPPVIVPTKTVAPATKSHPVSTKIEAPPTEAADPMDVTITKVVCPPLPHNMDSLTQDQFTSELTRKCLYDKLSKPHTEEPLKVSMQVDLSHIESADQLQFKAHMLVQYLYNDKRLKFDQISPKRGNILGQQLLREKIWVPHITIRNDKDTSVSGIDAKDVFVSISPQGEVVYSYRMTATFYCWMNLHKFPFDSQECDLRWYSWAYNSSHLVLRWEEGNHPVKIASNLYLTEFVLDGAWTSETEVPASFTKGAFVGNFSELVFKFKLAREVGYYIMDYYLPSILLVCISWVSFWLQADASPPRVTLGTATMLSFITLNGALTKSLPKVSYITASEIWFLACACFIFLSMAEFAFVNVIWRRKKEVELKKQSSKHILKGALTPSLARKQLRKEESAGSLYRPRSCSSLDDNATAKANTESNYLTVHSFPSNLNIPTIKTQSQDDLIESDNSVTSIPIPGNKQEPPTWHTMTPHEVAIWIDNKSRIVFPVTFLIFNIFYWSFVYVL